MADCCPTVSLSPDGTRLLVWGGNGAQILDLQGNVVGHAPSGGVWADDSRHLCELRPTQPTQMLLGSPADLVVVDPGHGERVVAQVPGYGPHTGPGILRCSITDDEAIVSQSFTSTIAKVTAVQLSTGRTSTPRWVPNVVLAEVVALSGSGRFVLERVGGKAQVVDATTSAVVGHTDAGPEALSWDGHLVVQSTATSDLEVVDWRNGVVLWRSAYQPPGCPCVGTNAAISARPNSDDLALAVSNEPGQPNRQAALWLITAHSRPKLIANPVRFGII